MEIKLVEVTERDLAMIMNWRMKKEVTEYMFTDPQITIEQQLKWFQKISIAEDNINWIIKVNDIAIGLYSITNIDFKKSTCEIGYYIGELEYRAKGIMSKIEKRICEFIFNDLNIDKIYNKILSNNFIAIKMHEKYGFKLERIEKKAIYKKNQYFDIFIFVKSKDEI